jgi:hypothetical protein
MHAKSIVVAALVAVASAAPAAPAGTPSVQVKYAALPTGAPAGGARHGPLLIHGGVDEFNAGVGPVLVERERVMGPKTKLDPEWIKHAPSPHYVVHPSAA